MTKNVISMYPHQSEALNKMHNGCILCGGVGSGKSRTALAYYYILNGGQVDTPKYVAMRKKPMDLYIITTAKKRDSLEWEGELVPFLMSTNRKTSQYDHDIVIDSWNNIKKYVDVKNAFFIFDEQRSVGSGSWAKSFIRIAKSNQWIMLSATPGDTWTDYISVFIANGFYRNKTQFAREHIVYARYTDFPKIERYINVDRLVRLRNRILVDMDFDRKTIRHDIDVPCDYDLATYKQMTQKRWDIYKKEPFQNAGALCYAQRRLVVSDISRQIALSELLEKHPKVIIFYNFDYERDILLKVCDLPWNEVAEWSGHAHQEIPGGESWVYLVQYTAGCEGWNSIKTDTIIFFSQSYSYKVMEQARGRIDRLNTPFQDLYYYSLISKAPIERAIRRALKNKQNFNERRYVKW